MHHRRWPFKRLGPLIAFLAALVLLATLPGTARAAAANDSFAGATTIDPSSLPFSDSVQVDQASAEFGEPSPYCSNGATAQTVWYAITPTSGGVLRVSDSASFYYQFIAAYREDGAGLSGLANVGCASWIYGTRNIAFNVDAGKTYYIQAGSSYWSYGAISVSVELIPPPANDDFANATPIDALPFTSSVDTTGASLEQNEPTPTCGYGQSAGTVWYAFTPSVSGSYSASTPWSGFSSQVAAYSGSGLGNLTQIGCRGSGQLLTFHAEAGTTYYLQAGGIFGGRGTLSFTIDVAPNPVVNAYYYPGDPSMFDSVQFSDGSYDPGGIGIVSQTWSFGDGATASGCCPTHRYAVDGDYALKLAVTTGDGRTASKTQNVHVQTHDVSIAKLSVPQTGSAGQTRSISVGISNARYAESVQVQLFKNDALVGTLTQQVPVRGGGRTTPFSFNYTFTSDDAVLGKVTFKAVAVVVGARDAQPADNTAIGLPTSVHG
jgi:PKD domain